MSYCLCDSIPNSNDVPESTEIEALTLLKPLSHWTFSATTTKEMPKLTTKINSHMNMWGDSQPTTLPPSCASETNSPSLLGLYGVNVNGEAGAPRDVWAAGSAKKARGAAGPLSQALFPAPCLTSDLADASFPATGASCMNCGVHTASKASCKHSRKNYKTIKGKSSEMHTIIHL